MTKAQSLLFGRGIRLSYPFYSGKEAYVNTLHLTYALEVEKTGSITLAAENLYMTQPTLSKAIKDLEESLGFAIFKRTSKGVLPTTRGIEFLAHARKIATQIDRMEQALHAKDTSHQLFSIAIPRVSYIAQAVSEFACSFDNTRDMEIDILETSSMKVIDAVANSHFVLGVIRYHVEDADYFQKNLAENGLQYETIWESSYQVLLRDDHPLASQDRINREELDSFIEIAFGDDEVPYIRTSESKAGHSTDCRKRLLIYDRAMQFDLLRANPLAYMWVSPVSNAILRRNGLAQRKCQTAQHFKDVLISRSGYRMSGLDREFINRLYLRRNEIAYGERE